MFMSSRPATRAAVFGRAVGLCSASQVGPKHERAEAHDALACYLLAAAIQLLVEVLSIEGVGRSGNTSQSRKGDQSGDDGLHGWYS